MKNRWILLGSILGVLVLALAAGLSLAQGPEPPGEGIQPQDVSIEAVVNSRISYQGVLKESGQPVNGTRNMTFRFYTNSTCTGTPVQTVTKNNVQVSNGLFTVALDVDQANFNGQGLWMAVDVGGTVVGCQEILPVPYALSLRPGAIISGTKDLPAPILYVYNTGTGRTIWAGTGGHTALEGWNSGSGTGVWGGSANGLGVGAHSDNGVAFKATGTGIIQSTAVSRIFVPGTEAVPHAESRSNLTLKYYGRGTMTVTSSATGSQKIVIPIQVPAILYGQAVRIRDMRVHYQTSNPSSYIDNTYLYRQTLDGGYTEVISNTTNYTSTTFTYYHTPCSVSACRLGDEASFLTVLLELNFASTAHEITIGGVRLTLEHE